MTTATSIKIDDELKARIKELAAVRRRSSHWIMCEAIAQYVEREEKRESLKKDALEAWDDFQENGQHVTSQEADSWMEKLENGEVTEAPECHS